MFCLWFPGKQTGGGERTPFVRTFFRRRRELKRCIVAVLAGPLLVAGCREGTDAEGVGKLPFAGQTITVAVPEGSDFARVLEAERGEWAAQTGASLKIVRYAVPAEEGGMREALASHGSPADVLIYPARAVGELAVAGLVEPLRDEVLKAPGMKWRKVFPALREAVATWGKQTVVAVPLGSPVMACWYRRDLLAAAGLEPAQTWDDLLSLAEAFESDPPVGAPKDWSPLALPLGPSTRRALFISIAASFAKHRDNYSFFFKIDAMEPLIANEGFVRALETLVRLQQFAPADAREHDASDARAAFRNGTAALALAWGPTSDEEIVDRAEGFEAGNCELPGAREVFNPFRQEWVTADGPEGNRVSFVGGQGWVASVSAESTQQEGAAYLLTRLGSGTLGTQLVMANPDSVLVRADQFGALADRLRRSGWTPQEAEAYAATLSSALERPNTAVVGDLRLPGRARYNRALEEALGQVLAGKTDARTALEEAARQWKAITSELGVEQQQSFYNQGLGLSPISSP